MTRGRWALAVSVAIHAAALLVPLPPGPGPGRPALLLVNLIAEAEKPPERTPAEIPGQPPGDGLKAGALGAREAGVPPRPEPAEAPVPQSPPPLDREGPGEGETVEEPPSLPERSTAAAGRDARGRAAEERPEDPSRVPPLARSTAPEPDSAPAGITEPRPAPGPAEAAEPARDPFPLMRERIMAAASYPVIARKRGWQGTSRVRFLVDAAGFPSTMELVESSGFAVLDRASLRAVEKGAPYPGIEGWVSVPVVFRLEG